MTTIIMERARIMIRPIETVYADYKFRSRLEARWAVFFDALGIRWEYEKEGYDLGEQGYYLPDFWVPSNEDSISAFIDTSMWFEITAGSDNDCDSTIQKLSALCKHTGWAGRLVCGLPDRCSLIPVDQKGRIGSMVVDEDASHCLRWLRTELGYEYTESFDMAARAAKSAWFGRGERSVNDAY